MNLYHHLKLKGEILYFWKEKKNLATINHSRNLRSKICWKQNCRLKRKSMKEQGGREMIRARKETHLKFQDYKRKMREKKKFRTWIHVGVILASSFPSKSHFYINQTKQSTVSPEKTLQNTKLSDNWWNKIHKIIQMVTHLLLNSQNSLLFSVQSRPLFFPLQEEEDSERKFRRKCKDQRRRRTQSSCPLHDTFFLSFSIPYFPFTKKTLIQFYLSLSY